MLISVSTIVPKTFVFDTATLFPIMRYKVQVRSTFETF